MFLRKKLLRRGLLQKHKGRPKAAPCCRLKSSRPNSSPRPSLVTRPRHGSPRGPCRGRPEGCWPSHGRSSRVQQPSARPLLLNCPSSRNHILGPHHRTSELSPPSAPFDWGRECSAGRGGSQRGWAAGRRSISERGRFDARLPRPKNPLKTLAATPIESATD
jgi:hypothetical protein